MDQETKVTTLTSDYSKTCLCQPTLNVGMIGHVSHGKSTLVEALSGVKTAKHDEEISKNMTMRLGYANVKIWLCLQCPKPQCYSATSSKPSSASCQLCDSPLTLQRHISFVDCPGHELLMATMLNGSAVMDAALLLIAANESCPQMQTQEHLQALELKGIKKFCVLQNKVDLVDTKKAQESYKHIKDYAAVKAQSLLKAPVVPISAQHRLNLEFVCQYLANLPVPERDMSSPLLIVIRSFDINKPGQAIDTIKGGVAGGSLLKGTLSVGTRVEVRPGLVLKKPDGTTSCIPLFTTVVSISSEHTKLSTAIPGGLIGVETTLDPSLTKSDLLVGHLIGIPGAMPPIFQIIVISYSKVKGVDSAPEEEKPATNNKKQKKSTDLLQVGTDLRVNINSLTTTAKVLALNDQSNILLAKLKLALPCCAHVNQKITFSQQVGGKWKITGVGTILPESSPLKV